ncbi:hypothetical protein SAMN05421848_1526 [Kushneria avicenniae]|uniref:Uncharacterized protein n=1 Tax=Kushneria avicenniae TaxID=402385 RepID=A0A1I1JGI8_9GAMM|nr:hypothetical protein SAMN05421848_1526 [Kushneria avicenniae]
MRVPIRESAPCGADPMIHGSAIKWLSAMAFLELLPAPTGTRVVAADILQGIARGLLWTMVAVRAMDMTMVVMIVMMVVLAIRAVNVGLSHVVIPGGRDVVIIATAQQKRSPSKRIFDTRNPSRDCIAKLF